MSHTPHSVVIASATAVLVLGMLLPFLPGRYDSLAVPLSLMCQILARGGLLLVPIGALWVASRYSSRLARNQYAIAIAALITSSAVWIVASLGALVTSGVVLGLSAIAVWIYALVRIVPRLRLLKNTTHTSVAGSYLLIVPVAALLFQIALARPAIEFSRGRAIRNSTPLIADIEQYRAVNGRYPESLLSANEDYWPGVAGIEKYHYEPSGDAYNVFFEQFAIVFGTREFVMYNPRDQQVFTSHKMDRLELSPQQLALEQTRGHYAVRDAGYPHWKYFSFD